MIPDDAFPDLADGFVVMLSGGLASWAAGRRTPYPKLLLFCDTLIEDADLYRFLGEAAADLDAPLFRIADGRTPWDVFDAVKFLGNNRVAPCSRVLKQEQARAWMTQHNPKHDATIVLGYDWTEFHRVEAATKGWAPWRVWAPLTEPPYLTRADMANELAAADIALPRLYRLGFPHNNCGGGCVRAGHEHWRHVLRAAPEVYDEWERQEERQRERLGNVAILRHRSGPKIGEPLPLAEFRTLQETDQLGFDWGGCGCFDG